MGLQSKTSVPKRGEYNVYSTFQSHEPEFDYLKSLEIEEKINKIRWLRRKNPAHFLLSTNDKTIKLWKVSERDKRAEGYNLKDEAGELKDRGSLTGLRVMPVAHYIKTLLRLFDHIFLSIDVGPRIKTNGAYGGGVPSSDLRQRAHVSHKFDLG